MHSSMSAKHFLPILFTPHRIHIHRHLYSIHIVILLYTHRHQLQCTTSYTSLILFCYLLSCHAFVPLSRLSFVHSSTQLGSSRHTSLYHVRTSRSTPLLGLV
ncbi:hypothetical protein BDN70DRAFT_187949 [Pholiota conissans]|uniref:Uncharacterized protein n=1 Tax=Pholiota conissans TaxID=109636 RepID=A0A9P6CY06_9AGAR|nr:hypothetical protein BDN70DRAFT_187949 [Pholiota conissans]